MTCEKTNTAAALIINAEAQHDLLNWLNQIIGYSEMLVEEINESGQTKLLKDLTSIHDAAQNMLRLMVCLSGANHPASMPSPDNSEEKAQTFCQEVKKSALSELDSDSAEGIGKILVVDDNENNRELLSRHLQRQGYQILLAENGGEALSTLAQKRVDVVLLDVMMPDMDGYAVLKQLRSSEALRVTPVIMISAHTDMDYVIKCIELGAEDYLPKPFNPTLLKARIGAVLEKKRLREQEMSFISQVIQVEASLERQRSLTQAVAGVAHEINTPLGIVKTGLSIINNRLSLPKIAALFAEDPKNAELLRDILESSRLTIKNIDTAHRLVENFKKIAINQLIEHKEVVHLPSLIKDAIDLFKVSAKQAKIDIDLNFDGISKEQEWYGFPGYITQILLNFLQNIERYAYPEGKGGSVAINVSDQIGMNNVAQFIIKVRDFGKGISSENIGKIFEPFYTTGRGRGGSGLGLAIVNNMVSVGMRGTLSVDSKLGRGTCFTVCFPKNLNRKD
jgi:signal transduction histidine kinase